MSAMSTDTAPLTKRHLRIVKVTNLQPGDIVKISGRTVRKIDTSGTTWPPFEGQAVTAIYFEGNNNPHVWFNDRRLAVYR
jgi:hypothetical protein